MPLLKIALEDSTSIDGSFKGVEGKIGNSLNIDIKYCKKICYPLGWTWLIQQKPLKKDTQTPMCFSNEDEPPSTEV